MSPSTTSRSMKSLVAVFFALFCISLIQTPAVMAEDKIYLDIAANQTRKIKFAVPSFASKGGGQNLGTELADILGKALAFHGIITIIPASDYGGDQSANWKQVGADYVVLGQFSASGDGLSFELRLQDATSGSTVLGKSFSGSMDQKYSMLYKFCDSIIESLTGKPGIASSQIAFISYVGNSKEAYITDILGSFLRRVTRHNNLVISPRFTRDGKFLAYSSYHTGNQNMYITDLSQNKTTKLLFRHKGLNYAPAWSHSGQYLIVTLSKDGNPDLYLCTPQGEIIEQLTNNQGINVSASWSPDDSKIVFTSDRTGKPQLYTMDMRTRQTQRLTFEGSENAEPCWSPTEDMIVYSSLTGGVYQLFMIRASGGSPIQLTDDLSHHESPFWSPDGNQVIFAKRGGKAHTINAIMKNGSFQRQLFSFPGDHTYPQWSR